MGAIDPPNNRPVWRLLHHFDRPGVWQMAVDDMLRTWFRPGVDRPIVRLYSWQPACLTLGYGQSAADVDWDACREAGVDVVRRPTGGRAVLHDRELTYAVIAAIDDPSIGGSISASYRAIATGLLAGLVGLGVSANLTPGDGGGDLAARRSGACYAAATRSEITREGRKLVGSAQLRRQGVLLQHGSLPLAPGRWPLGQLLRRQPAADLSAHLRQVSTTVADAMGQALTAPAAAERFGPAFAAGLAIDLVADQLTAAELDQAAALVVDQYQTGGWTYRR